MKKVMKIFGIIILCILVLVAVAIALLTYSSWKLKKNRVEDQANMRKPDKDLLGVRLDVPREGKDPVDVKAQVLCYAYIGDAVELYNNLSSKQQATIAPALFVLADDDSFSDESLAYQKVLEKNKVSTRVKQYVGSIHGFIEENNPEYENLHIKISKSPEQEQIARKAEDFIGAWLNEQL